MDNSNIIHSPKFISNSSQMLNLFNADLIRFHSLIENCSKENWTDSFNKAFLNQQFTVDGLCQLSLFQRKMVQCIGLATLEFRTKISFVGNMNYHTSKIYSIVDLVINILPNSTSACNIIHLNLTSQAQSYALSLHHTD